jgi:hypothetical protein
VEQLSSSMLEEEEVEEGRDGAAARARSGRLTPRRQMGPGTMDTTRPPKKPPRTAAAAAATTLASSASGSGSALPGNGLPTQHKIDYLPGGGDAAAPPAPSSAHLQVAYPPGRSRADVSGAFPSWNRSIWTGIYLCHACSDHEILRVETPGRAAELQRRRRRRRGGGGGRAGRWATADASADPARAQPGA